MAKTHVAIVLCGLLGLISACATIDDIALFVRGVYRSPENPDWNSVSGVGFGAGISYVFLFLTILLSRLRPFPAVLEKIRMGSPKKPGRFKQLIKLKIIFLVLGLFCFLVFRPVLYVATSLIFVSATVQPEHVLVIKSNELVPNWLQAIPCVAGNLLLYFAMTYPFSFRWPFRSVATKTDSSPSPP
jgi:hypothetical protein